MAPKLAGRRPVDMLGGVRDQLREGPVSQGPFDVAIVGAGAVGCAIARELSGRGASCVLLEAGPDVGAGTSKANTAILHTGFDAKPGSLEARLVAQGHDLLLAYARNVGIPIEETARECGYERTRRLSAAELYAREPHLGRGALGALEIPDEFIVCPWTP